MIMFQNLKKLRVDAKSTCECELYGLEPDKDGNLPTLIGRPAAE